MAYLPGALSRLLIALAFMAAVWWPQYEHFLIDRSPLPATTVAELITSPADAVLSELGGMSLAVTLEVPPAEVLQTAKGLLQGVVRGTSFANADIPLRGWPHDLLQTDSTFQLAVASLGIEDLLLDAFQHTGDAAYYRLARSRLLTFAEWEAAQREPIAFLWNDHAVAARIPVLIRFWRNLRNDPNSTPEQRQQLLALISRSGELLAKPGQFTVRTNHGVMQNLALLQICAAFPLLPQAGQWRQLAIDRLGFQLPFYVSEEGVVLEHSSEYHILGTELLAYALRLIRLNGREPSRELAHKAMLAQDFAGKLIRPDGSLPLIGNTAAGRAARIAKSHADGGEAVIHQAPPFAPPAAGAYGYPVSGYALWWSDRPVISQLAIAWAKHDRHGHKHADEPSIGFWADNRDWLTASGYWPYDAPYYTQAIGWAGANAPHLVGEDLHVKREVTVLAEGAAGDIRFIDLENRRASGYHVRRQILQWSAGEFLVLDSAQGAEQTVETVWTLAPDLSVQVVGKDRFQAAPSSGRSLLHIAFDSREASEPAQLYIGSTQPFAGWVVEKRQVLPAPAIRVLAAQGNSMTAAYFKLSGIEESPAVSVIGTPAPTEWAVSVGNSAGRKRISRKGGQILIENGERLTLDIAAPKPFSEHRAELRQAMTSAIDRYPPWRDLARYRKKLLIWIGVVYASIETAIIGIVLWKKHYRWLHWISLALWLAFALWAVGYYLR